MTGKQLAFVIGKQMCLMMAGSAVLIAMAETIAWIQVTEHLRKGR